VQVEEILRVVAAVLVVIALARELPEVEQALNLL
jgi:hypothetical protein